MFYVTLKNSDSTILYVVFLIWLNIIIGENTMVMVRLYHKINFEAI